MDMAATGVASSGTRSSPNMSLSSELSDYLRKIFPSLGFVTRWIVLLGFAATSARRGLITKVARDLALPMRLGSGGVFLGIRETLH